MSAPAPPPKPKKPKDDKPPPPPPLPAPPPSRVLNFINSVSRVNTKRSAPHGSAIAIAVGYDFQTQRVAMQRQPSREELIQVFASNKDTHILTPVVERHA